MTKVKFPDDQQQAAVLVILGRSQDTNKEVELQELAAVTELYIVGRLHKANVAKLTFTHEGECWVNVKMSEGKVRDLSVIGKMAYLEKLALVYQPLSDPSPLSGLVMLNELYLSGDRSLTNLKGLKDLPRLETLHLEHSGIRDLSPLGDLPSLRKVTVSADMLPLTLPAERAFTLALTP